MASTDGIQTYMCNFAIQYPKVGIYVRWVTKYTPGLINELLFRRASVSVPPNGGGERRPHPDTKLQSFAMLCSNLAPSWEVEEVIKTEILEGQLGKVVDARKTTEEVRRTRNGRKKPKTSRRRWWEKFSSNWTRSKSPLGTQSDARADGFSDKIQSSLPLPSPLLPFPLLLGRYTTTTTSRSLGRDVPAGPGREMKLQTARNLTLNFYRYTAFGISGWYIALICWGEKYFAHI